MEQLGGIARRGPFTHVVISCEHASNRLPARYADLGLKPGVLNTHVAWDPGARPVARHCARRLGCRYHEGRYSRLLIDLNRNLHNPKLIPRLSFGVPIPGNAAVSTAEREARLHRYYTPYRDGVLRDIRHTVGRRETCMHVSVHSFTPRLGGRTRRADVGVLYDPGRVVERWLAGRLVDAIKQKGLHVRRNYPYRGTSDGLTTFCRSVFPRGAYAGIELEINQALLGHGRAVRDIAESLASSLEAVMADEFRTGKGSVT
ncbi:MAG TPA: N-formylglutamate amidohydrolase [Gemmatimonadota bacterium]|nr:N-formylglutamate amidohydrolase [Gemmatimonadota bacterium]